MPPRSPMPSGPPFGKRMAAIRKETGYSQRELAAELGISQRMVAYYEGQTEYPPVHLLPALSEIFGISTDALLGIRREVPRGPSTRRFWGRLRQIQRLPPKAKKKLLFVIDSFLDHYDLEDDDEDDDDFDEH